MENEIKDTLNNGESDVQVATIGPVVGSSIDGDPVEQNFTEESLKRIAEETTDEILVDADHSSEKNGDTSAKGWLSNLRFIPGKGLFGKIKWTDIGRKLIENRVFRWLSPSWIIDRETKEPVLMTSCALTNKPSQLGRIDPIVNSQANEESAESAESAESKETISTENSNKDVLTMTIEELKDLIKTTIDELATEKAEEVVEEKTEETKSEETEETEDTEETAENQESEVPEVEEKKIVEEKIEEKSEDPVVDTCAKNEEVKEEVVEEKKIVEDKEVIPLETLNSAPIPTIADEPKWKKMTPAEFCKWYDNGRK